MIPERVIIQQAMLSRGEYAAAFAKYDTEQSQNDLIMRKYNISRWHGTEDLRNKRILITHGWGLGDCIMALRFVPLLNARSKAIAVPQPLMRIAKMPNVFVLGETVLLDYDYHCPIVRLIGFFPLIPKPPYLKVRRAWVEDAKKITNGKRRVGIAWSGNKKHLRDGTRSMALEKFLGLLPQHNVRFYSLQNTEHELAERCGVVAPRYQDFAEVAAMATLMDEIVSVDTACINLVGALGLSGTVMLDHDYDWRWRRGDDWYPTIRRCVQQQQGDWESAFTQLRR
jgi:hypothetical protein